MPYLGAVAGLSVATEKTISGRNARATSRAARGATNTPAPASQNAAAGHAPPKGSTSHRDHSATVANAARDGASEIRTYSATAFAATRYEPSPPDPATTGT